MPSFEDFPKESRSAANCAARGLFWAFLEQQPRLDVLAPEFLSPRVCWVRQFFSSQAVCRVASSQLIEYPNYNSTKERERNRANSHAQEVLQEASPRASLSC